MASSSSLSNISICTPPKIQLSPRTNKIALWNGTVKAMAGGTRDNLDHLQRVTLQQPQQPKQGLPQVAPKGPSERFPAAKTAEQMMGMVERMTEDPCDYRSTWPLVSVRERNGYSRGRTPWAIQERENDYKLRFDMPGMTKNDVKVWVEENMLVIKAEKVSNKKQQGQVTVDQDMSEAEEWPAKSFGRYSSRIALPENIAFENIKAEVKDGVLYLIIPKAKITSKIIGIQVE